MFQPSSFVVDALVYIHSVPSGMPLFVLLMRQLAESRGGALIPTILRPAGKVQREDNYEVV